MFQQFYEDTLFGRFVKSLLSQTRIPIFNSVSENDPVFEGCYYFHGSNIIRCTSSGVLGHSAKYNTLKLFDDADPACSETFVSKTNYYDSDTHYYLGKYLRYLRSKTGINLLPFYNCYNGTTFNDIELYYSDNNDVTVTRTIKQKSKVLGVPIQFGKKYKIYLDCDSMVMMNVCCHNQLGKIDLDGLDNSKVYASSSFSKPIEYIFEPKNINHVDFEKYLYLVIQLPISNNSSLVVIEDTDSTVSSSLCSINYRESFAFSDRLVEYLLNNVISANDNINKNIEKIQRALTRYLPYEQYGVLFDAGVSKYGHWDKYLTDRILELVSDTNEFFLNYDQDGNINKDIEQLLESKGVNY